MPLKKTIPSRGHDETVAANFFRYNNFLGLQAVPAIAENSKIIQYNGLEALIWKNNKVSYVALRPDKLPLKSEDIINYLGLPIKTGPVASHLGLSWRSTIKEKPL